MSEKTVSPVDPKELRGRLESVNTELRRIGQTVRQDADSLERLRQMLDVNYVSELMGLVEEMERQVSGATEAAANAAEETEAYRRRLGEEEERLEKLWDAYKAQEREFRQAQDAQARLERELAEKHASVAESETILKERERDLAAAEEENESLRDRVRDLEAQAEELQHVTELKDRVDDLEQKYQAEKERLAKLYTVYEELEGERDNLRTKVEEWERWFKQAAPHFEQGYRAVKRRSTTARPEPEPEPVE